MKKIMTVIAAVLAIAGCSKISPDSVNTSKDTSYVTRAYKAGLENKTRTSADEAGHVSWKQGDVLRYYSRKEGEVKQFTIAQDTTNAELNLEVASTASFLIGVYGGTGLSENLGSSVLVEGAVPAVQSGAFGDSHVAVTKTYNVTQETLHFHNMVGFIQFSLARNDVKRVVFKANDQTRLHGNGMMRVTFVEEAATASFGDEGGYSISVSTNGAGTFYIATLPCELAQGFSLDCYDATGTYLGSAISVKKAVIKQDNILNLGTIDSRITPSSTEYVDMGLSVMWAKCNLGASVPEGEGNLYAWGECSPKSYFDWDNYVLSNGGNYLKIEKYSGGDILLPEDDAASSILGEGWSIPGSAEWNELKNNCLWTLTSLNGVEGYRVVSEINGNEIFIPSVDYNWSEHVRLRFLYWESDLVDVCRNEGLHVLIDDDADIVSTCETHSCAVGLSGGKSVRPVFGRGERPIVQMDDLSSSGTANCYIVSSPGNCKFRIGVKGGSSTPLDGTPYRAEVLWESFGTTETPSVGDVISDVKLANGYVYFTAGRNGNAVIAVENRDEDILWSWHIWVCEGYDPEKTYQWYNGREIMMDRNLGATSATPGDVHSLGLLYQWGRKDPFLGGSATSSNKTYSVVDQASSTITWPKTVASTKTQGTIEYSIEHPTTFITENSNNYDWYYNGGLSSTDNTRWTSSQFDKGLYDPCPYGYRVPDGGTNGVWCNAFGVTSYWKTSTNWDPVGKGFDFAKTDRKASNYYESIWYPCTGELSCSSAILYYAGTKAGYWASTTNSYDADCLRFESSGTITPQALQYRSYGYSVRCVREL